MKEVTEAMVASIKKKIAAANKASIEMNVEPLMKMITMDIFGKTTLDVDLKSCSGDLKTSPLAQAFQYITEQLMIRMKNPLQPKYFFYSFDDNKNSAPHFLSISLALAPHSIS